MRLPFRNIFCTAFVVLFYCALARFPARFNRRNVGDRERGLMEGMRLENSRLTASGVRVWDWQDEPSRRNGGSLLMLSKTGRKRVDHPRVKFRSLVVVTFLG